MAWKHDSSIKLKNSINILFLWTCHIDGYTRNSSGSTRKMHYHAIVGLWALNRLKKRRRSRYLNGNSCTVMHKICSSDGVNGAHLSYSMVFSHNFHILLPIFLFSHSVYSIYSSILRIGPTPLDIFSFCFIAFIAPSPLVIHLIFLVHQSTTFKQTLAGCWWRWKWAT